MFGILIVDQPDQPPCFDRGTCGYIYIVGANLQGSLGPKQTRQVKAKKSNVNEILITVWRVDFP